MKSIKAIRNKLVERDGWLCHYCGCQLRASKGYGDSEAADIAQLEHKIPESRGGSWELDNLVLACRHCNSKKRLMTDEEFKAKLEIVWRYYEWCNEDQRRIIPSSWLLPLSR